jgi:hypothetical protein
LETLERRVIVQIQHILQIKLEIDGGAYQPGEQLEEVGIEPTQKSIFQRRELSINSEVRQWTWSLQ